MDPKSPSKFKLSITGFTRCRRNSKFFMIVLVIFMLLIGLYYAFKVGKSRVRDSHFTVVVDCGSTGTRVNVYKWRIGNMGDWDLPVLVHSYPDNLTETPLSASSCKYHCMQTEPGLDKFVGNATGVRLALEPLIQWAERWVPCERHRDTPIFVLATAGLRKLRTEDSRQVLDDVDDVLKKHSFVYRRLWIRVLSGKEEAYYGWVALNYKMERLGDSSRGPTLGLLDLGGSSLQVVMEVDGGVRDDAHLIRSKIGLVEHQILAFSLPSFGLNEAFDRTVAMLSQAQLVGEYTNGRVRVSHPCLSSDFLQNYTCYLCNELNSTRHRNLSSQEDRSDYIYLVGDPNWELCKAITKAAAINSSSFDWSQPTFSTNCKASKLYHSGSNILNFTSRTHSTGRFHALSGFFAVYNMLNLATKANFTKIWKKGQQLCSESWANSNGNSDYQNYIRQYCFRVPYMTSLIEDALCLGDKEIMFGPGDVSWTLGAALVEGKDLWLRSSETGISSLRSFEVIRSPVFVFLVLMFLSLVVYSCQIKLPMPGRKVVSVGTSLPSYIYPKRSPN